MYIPCIVVSYTTLVHLWVRIYNASSSSPVQLFNLRWLIINEMIVEVLFSIGMWLGPKSNWGLYFVMYHAWIYALSLFGATFCFRRGRQLLIVGCGRFPG